MSSYLLHQHAAPWYHDDDDAARGVTMLTKSSGGSLAVADVQREISAAMGGWGSSMTRSGLSIGPQQAVGVAAVFACRRAIAEDVAKLPMEVRKYKIESGTRSHVALPDHPIDKLLTEAPNDWQTPFEFLEYLVGTAVLYGGGYALISRNEQTGKIEELLPLLPGSVQVWQDEYWRPRYSISGYGEGWTSDGSDLLRLIGPSHDTIAGHPTIDVAREAIGLATAIESAASRFHANDLRPAGILKTKNIGLKPEIREAMRDAWQTAYGPGGRGGVAILDSDFEFQALTGTSVDGQVIENRRFQIEEICRFFRVVPAMIGHSAGSVGYNGLEQLVSMHGNMTILPWVKRLEQALKRDLFGPDERALSVHVDLDALLRGTPSDHINLLDRATKVVITPNEARIRLGLDPIKNDPDMDRVQLQRNNTGTTPAGFGASPKPTSKPETSQPTLDKPSDTDANETETPDA